MNRRRQVAMVLAVCAVMDPAAFGFELETRRASVEDLPSIAEILKSGREKAQGTPALTAQEIAGAPSGGCSPEQSAICPGDEVYLVQSRAPDLVGTVWNVFSNGEAQVCFKGYCHSTMDTDNVDLRTLSKSQSCYKDICVDDLAINSHNQIVRVLTVFANGKIRVRARNAKPTKTYRTGYGFRSVTDDPRKFTDADRLTKTQNCFGDVCVGGMVMDDRNAVGVVKAAFPNGKIGVLYPGGAAGHDNVFETWRVRDAHQLVAVQAVNCLGEICVNDTVIGPSRKVGLVVAMYSNGKALLDFYGIPDGAMADASSLVKAVK